MTTTLNKLKEDKQIKIVYKGKKYTINISKELSINEDVINTQLKDLPSSYYFLCEVKNDYIRRRDNTEREMNLAYSKAWRQAKDSDRTRSNDYVEHMAKSNNKYQSLYEEWLLLAEKASDLIAACKAYQSREDILRTLSANLRQER